MMYQAEIFLFLQNVQFLLLSKDDVWSLDCKMKWQISKSNIQQYYW